MSRKLDVILLTGKGKENPLVNYYVHSALTKNLGKVVLGSNSNKTCRFCGKNASLTTFKKKAHIIPEFMGNKLFFSNYECDICNDYLGNLEDSLSNFAGIFNSLSMVKGKRGYPKYKDKKNGIEALAKSNNTIVTSLERNANSDSISHGDGIIKFDINQPGYFPQDAFKSLVKIALLMMDENEFSNYEEAIKWIVSEINENQENNPFFNVFRKIGGKKRFVQPWCALLQKKDSKALENYPSHSLILFYGILQYQIFLPFHKNEQDLFKQNKIYFPLSEFVVTEKNRTSESVDIGYDRISLGGTEKVKSERMKFSFGFKERK